MFVINSLNNYLSEDEDQQVGEERAWSENVREEVDDMDKSVQPTSKVSLVALQKLKEMFGQG